MSSKKRKRSNGTFNEKPVKLRRKVITLAEKLDILKRYENNERTCDIMHVTGLNEATLRCIRSNAEKIKRCFENATPDGAKRCNKVRPNIMQVMENQLVDWINSKTLKNSDISTLTIKSEALSIFENLKKDFPNDSKLDFTASSGWFYRFKIRHQLQNLKLIGDNIITNCVNSNLSQCDNAVTESKNASSGENSSFVPKMYGMYVHKDTDLCDSNKVNQIEKLNDTLTKDVLEKNLGQIDEALCNLQKFDKKVKRSSTISTKVKHLLKPYYDLLEEKLKTPNQLPEETGIFTEVHSITSQEYNYDSDIETPAVKSENSFVSEESNELILPI